MKFPVAYDITRLTTRVLNRTPNGIDRVDLAYASNFLAGGGSPRNGMLFLRALGLRVLTREGSMEVIEGIAAHLGEEDNPNFDPGYRQIKDWLRHGVEPGVVAAQRIVTGRKNFAGGVLGWIKRHGLPHGRSPVATLPREARYVNVSQYPLAIPGSFDWLARRPDIRPIFFIHDLLPLEAPEYFRPGEYERHVQRLQTLARFGAGAIVSTHVVKSALEDHLARLDRRNLPILVAPLPVAPIFGAQEEPDAELGRHPYFVLCGTLEPRKNHLLILHVWRELARRHGDAAPKLILIGARGWESENIDDLLDRCRPLRDHVLEVSGLPTPSFKRVLKGARALLMPSFAEGYGLPIAEALATGAPVIASDIPVFREVAGDRFVGLSPIDGEGWLRVIEDFARLDPNADAPAHAHKAQPSFKDYFAGVEEFADNL